MFAFLGHAFTLAGRVDEGVKQLEYALEGAERIRHFACTSLWIGWLADAYRQAGRLEESEQTPQRAIDVGRRYHERGFEGYGLRELGDAIAAVESPDVAYADGLYKQALAIADEPGMRPLQARCHLSLGKLYRKTGRDHDARAGLNVAIDLYLSMEMTHWLPEAEAELAEVAATPS
jgi:tetratricopeptide (TPR) repeat protein